FGLLFLAFSFFLIAAALMLVGLLFRLNLDRRASEVGLLLATGFPQQTVRRLLRLGGMVLAAAGAPVRPALGPPYAHLLLRILISLWPSGGVGSFLRLHVSSLSLGLGFVAAVLMSQLAILWALRVLRRIPPAALLAGVATPPVDPTKLRTGSRWAVRI